MKKWKIEINDIRIKNCDDTHNFKSDILFIAFAFAFKLQQSF